MRSEKVYSADNEIGKLGSSSGLIVFIHFRKNTFQKASNPSLVPLFMD